MAKRMRIFCLTDVMLKLKTILTATLLVQPLLITVTKAWLATMRKFSDQLCALYVKKHLERQLNLLTRINGATVLQSLPKTATLLANSRLRSKLAKLALTYQSQFLYQCSHLLVTKVVCGALLTSMAKALFNSIHNGRQLLLAGRKNLQKHKNCSTQCLSVQLPTTGYL